MRDHVRFFLNGAEQIVRGETAFITFSEYLRVARGLVGTKVVCAEGDCGACTVLVGRPVGDRVQFLPIDCCIQFVHQLDGTHVVTVEALPDAGELHPVQQAMADHHAAQCGYCTPGIVMALAGWKEAGADCDPAALRLALTGNLCRCTGYVPILAAAEAAARVPLKTVSERFANSVIQESLRLAAQESVRLDFDGREFFAPTTLKEAVAFKAAHPKAAIVAGATELGVWRNKRGFDPPAQLSLRRIPGLDAIETTNGRMVIGANVTWSQVEHAVRDSIPEFLRIIQRFGSPQIRNAATVIGNVANGSPIADSLPLFCVMDAEIEMVGPAGVRRRSINGFYTGYKKLDLHDDELISRVSLPMPTHQDRLRLYKVSRRNDLDIATFGAAIRLQMDGDKIASSALAYSGVAPTVVRLPRTESFLIGRDLDESTFRQAGRIARGEVSPITDVRGEKDFRLQLCENVLRKYFHDEIEARAEAIV